MRTHKQKSFWLTVASGAVLFQSGCVAGEVLETIALAFSIVDVWV